ncbi:MAG: RES family NAD+ phosphorylase [Candidatus Andeanibacterium colombiense]|uniref:RES family NAD+ phosphorylase n=1 Tax=Candidatus Andeanibacterium colombiense TaxID=3121345 RepID=A0AAJ6BQE3_9SPHN|nr:MAG: RES family NAD+ phosphorylase [Sphingomonadaceae bacterium]
MADIPTCPIRWEPCYRIIPSRFPPIPLFEKVAEPGDLEAVFAIEAMTNDRLREEAGDLNLVPKEDRVSGPGSSPIMAAFTHLNPEGDRFTDGTYGVFYASLTLDTAIEETKHHRSTFLMATDEPAQEIDMRVYAVNLNARLHDVRDMRDAKPEIYDPTNYAASQALASQLRADGSYGIVYQSVRHEGGECVAVFRPRLLSNCRQERHLCYVWDGAGISHVYEKRELSSGASG